MSTSRPDDRPILLVVHQKHSTPGRIGQTLEGLGRRLDVRRTGAGEALPAGLDGHGGVVIFGGPMSANDDHLPFIRHELDLIGTALDSGTPLLGVCLGGQLMARALGTPVRPHPDGWHEIGFYDLQPQGAGRALFAEQSTFFQWHGEGFGLPAGAERLAAGRHFENQCFRYGETAYAIQFHPEMTKEMIALWGREAADQLLRPGAQSREEHRRGIARHYEGIGRWLQGFLQDWLATDRRAPAETRPAAE